jgi:hypothetical protein
VTTMTIGGLSAAVSSCRACRFASSTSRRTTRSTRTTSRVSDAHAHAHPHAHTHVRTNTPSPLLLHVLSSAQRHHSDNHQHPPIFPSPRYTATLLLLSTIGTLHASTQPQTPSHTHEYIPFLIHATLFYLFPDPFGQQQVTGFRDRDNNDFFKVRCSLPLLALLPTNTDVEIPCKTADLRKHCYLLMMPWEVILLATWAKKR